MKRTLFSISTALCLLLAVMLVAEPAFAQRDNSRVRSSPNAKVSQTIGTTEIDMHYSRPGVKDRTVFGGLEAWGKVWRAGANEPTTITISGDVQVEGEALAAGTYALFIRPEESGDWGVIFTEMVGWGTQYDADKKVLEVAVTPKEGAHQEWMMYHFVDLSGDSATLEMHWASTIVPVTISTP